MLNRLPKLKDVIPVYAVIAFMVYAWAIIVFLWQVPAWLYYLNLGEILSIFAYRLFASFIESLIFLCIILIVTMILPPKWLKDSFTVRAATATICVLGAIMLYANQSLVAALTIPGRLYYWIFGSILLAILIGFFSTKIKPAASFLTWLSDSMTIFLYILMPLSAISLIVILIRNLL